MTSPTTPSAEIREGMPVLARHEGVWDGRYVHVDAEGAQVDAHDSTLTCRFPEAGDYHQTNRYTWADGRVEEIEFPASYRDGRIWFDTDRIKGSAWEIDDRTVVLHWSYKHDPQGYLYEMIQLSDCGNHRARTWHWFEGGELVKRTLIKEQKRSA
jgi:hypothetical protein